VIDAVRRAKRGLQMIAKLAHASPYRTLTSRSANLVVARKQRQARHEEL
jgi:hypothetical protein